MRHREDGFAVVEWLVGLSLMLLPATVMALSIATWSARANLAHGVAQETGRAAVVAPTRDAMVASAFGVADSILGASGIEGRVSCSGDDCASVTIASSLERGSVVTVRVAMVMPAIEVPFVGRVGRFIWTVTHEERIDDYRSLP